MTACSNRHGVPERELTEQVLAQFKRIFLNPVALGGLVMRELEARRAQPEALAAQRQELTRQIDRLTQELERAAEAGFGVGATPITLVQATHAKEAERKALQARLVHLDGRRPRARTPRRRGARRPAEKKDQPLSGRINRRVKDWCPRSDSPASRRCRLTS